jgi:hypothetical protein
MPTQTIAALKRERTKRLAKLGVKAYYLRKRGHEQQMYDLLCEEFLALGGVYVKFMQGVMFNTPIMRHWQSPSRLKIFENLDSEPLDVVRILRHELPPERLKDIVLIQPQPFAAGSFGQVYLGQHTSGQKVIIKVLRPMVRELLKYDLRLLGLFGKRFAAQEYTNITVKMNAAIKEFRHATLNETDYVAEAKFADELYHEYRDHPHVVIPKTYLDLCTPHLIVQEYIEGISGAELLKLKEAGGNPDAYIKQQLGSDLNKQLEIMGIECLSAAFRLPRLQGDPHPGNLRFMTHNRIGLIDFGISAPAPRNRPAFYGLLTQWSNLFTNADGDITGVFEQFMRYFVNDLYRALKKLSSITPGAQGLREVAGQYLPAGMEEKMQGNDLVREIGNIVQGAFDGATGARDVRKLLDSGQLVHAFSQLVNKDNRLGLVVKLESSEILRAAQTYVSMLDALDRRVDLFPTILDHAIKVVAYEHPDIMHDTDKSISTTQAINTINHWLERVAIRDPALFIQLLRSISPREKAAKLQTNKETVDA